MLGWAGLVQAWIPTAPAQVGTHCSGAVGALPAARALLVLHRTELVMLRASPGAPCAAGESTSAQCPPASGWLGTEGQCVSSHSPQAGRGAPMFGFLGDQFEGAKPVDVPKGREERVSAGSGPLHPALQPFSASRSMGTLMPTDPGLFLCPLFETEFHVA